LFFNGLRASEAAAAALEDLGEHDGHRVLWVRGKGKTETNQRVPLNAPTVAALEAWLAERARIAGATATPGPLLISPGCRAQVKWHSSRRLSGKAPTGARCRARAVPYADPYAAWCSSCVLRTWCSSCVLEAQRAACLN
jgi:integrase/recombinase XerD